MYAVKFLAVVLVRLDITSALCHQAPERVVMVHLLDVAIGISHHPVVAKMVFEVEVVLG